MRSIARCVLFLALVLPAATVWGQQYVLTVPAPYPTIQSALNGAFNIIHGVNPGQTPGDVLIEVSPGTYVEALDLNGIDSPYFRVTLRAVQGQSSTIIDASTLGLVGRGMHAFRGTGVKNFTLDGFTVRNRYDPLEICCGLQGMRLTNSTRITVQNCFFDTTYVAMMFDITDPTFSSEVTVVHNTAIGGQGTDPDADDYMNGQSVNMTYGSYDPAAPPPTGDHKLIVSDNVFRCNGSAVRYQMVQYDHPQPGAKMIGAFANGTLVMTGNDISTFTGAGTNTFGGHGHLIARNRFHDSTAGPQLTGVTGGIIENNISIRNGGPGLWVSQMPIIPGPIPDQVMLVRHNTVANNLGAGIVYSSGTVAPYLGVPSVYNNIVAFNDASGIAAVGPTSESAFAFISADLQLERNDVYGNTLRALTTPSFWFSFEGISNPEAATKNYAGAINTSLNLSVDPKFVDEKSGDFSLKKNSKLVDAGLISRPFPSIDFAGTLRNAAPDIGALEVSPSAPK